MFLSVGLWLVGAGILSQAAGVTVAPALSPGVGARRGLDVGCFQFSKLEIKGLTQACVTSVWEVV